MTSMLAPSHHGDKPPQHHVPVLLHETLEMLQPRPGGTYIDCTVGGGGHATAILEQSAPDGRLLGIDADPLALAAAQEAFGSFGSRVNLIRGNFAHLANLAQQGGFDSADGVLFDLGASSLQLGPTGRGFSFQYDAPLDMRFAPDQPITASALVNELSQTELADLLRQYGEERHAASIARAIVRSRDKEAITTTAQLARIVEQAVRGRRGRLHPATKTFLALRIAVNKELECLATALAQATALLAPAGRLVVISFHSLEDRIVKRFFQQQANGDRPTLAILTRKPVVPSDGERRSNPRSRSAKLRAAERLTERGEP